MLLTGQIAHIALQFMTENEANDIWRQLQNTCKRNKQLLWTGLHREAAQSFANKHGLHTLTMAMGPLMNKQDPRCLYATRPKSGKGWSKYIKGASALFAFYISMGDTVIVLTPPPPDRFHPLGLTNFDLIEYPILQGKVGNKAVGRIVLVHPLVEGAERVGYQLWPLNESSKWQAKFGEVLVRPVHWRKVALQSTTAKLAFVAERARTETATAKEARQQVHLMKLQQDQTRKQTMEEISSMIREVRKAVHERRVKTDQARKAIRKGARRTAHELKMKKHQARKAARQRVLDESLSCQGTEPWSRSKMFAKTGLSQQDLDDLGILEVYKDFVMIRL